MAENPSVVRLEPCQRALLRGERTVDVLVLVLEALYSEFIRVFLGLAVDEHRQMPQPGRVKPWHVMVSHPVVDAVPAGSPLARVDEELGGLALDERLYGVAVQDLLDLLVEGIAVPSVREDAVLGICALNGVDLAADDIERLYAAFALYDGDAGRCMVLYCLCDGTQASGASPPSYCTTMTVTSS
jgi:hypothetical protein